MAKAGLKVGDTFVDGGLTYEVLAVNADGTYHSRMCEPKAEKNVEEKVVAPKSTTKRTKKG